MDQIAEYLPHVNATLNAIATALLIVGYVCVKSGRLQAHKIAMLACFLTSILFLVCYLIYHANVGSKPFPKTAPPAARMVYFAILIPHVILAAAVPFLALVTIYYGLRERIESHRRFAKWTFPIWLFVSVTGVLVYLMLYQLFPSEAPASVDTTTLQRF